MRKRSTILLNAALVGFLAAVVLAAGPAQTVYLPRLIKDINPGSGSSNPDNLTAVNDALYFTATDGVNGKELWKSDGTWAGTNMVQDITPGSASSSFYELINAGGTLFFFNDNVTYTDGADHNFELWKSNSAGTSMLAGPWNLFGVLYFQSPPYLASADGRVYFFAWEDAENRGCL